MTVNEAGRVYDAVCHRAFADRSWRVLACRAFNALQHRDSLTHASPTPQLIDGAECELRLLNRIFP